MERYHKYEKAYLTGLKSSCNFGYFTIDSFLICSNFLVGYLLSHTTEIFSVFPSAELLLLCLQWHPFFFIYPMRAVRTSEDVRTVCPRLFLSPVSHPQSALFLCLQLPQSITLSSGPAVFLEQTTVEQKEMDLSNCMRNQSHGVKSV